jgi:hypothetical protein
MEESFSFLFNPVLHFSSPWMFGLKVHKIRKGTLVFEAQFPCLSTPSLMAESPVHQEKE